MVAERKVYDRLCLEIRSRFNSPEEITGQSAATLVFLDAAIHEGHFSICVY
jgi:hypothetical protein